MGFVEDLIPEVSFFPDFKMGISVDFLDFGGLSSAFGNVKLPELPDIPNPIDDMLEKFQDDLSGTPMGEIVSCGTDMACIGETTADALGLDKAAESVTSLIDKADEIQDRLSAAFDAAIDVELITCSEPTTKSIPVSYTHLTLPTKA